jgi:V-type H+-transporting ATPase subunit F
MASGTNSLEGALLGMIVDQDTATGMLLTGVGHVDIRRRSNFVIVDESEYDVEQPYLFNPNKIRRSCIETTQQEIENAFKDFTTREDIAVLLINQHIASTIRHLTDPYDRPVPAILEIPSKDQPYDPSQDSVLSRVKYIFGE